MSRTLEVAETAGNYDDNMQIKFTLIDIPSTERKLLRTNRFEELVTKY